MKHVKLFEEFVNESMNQSDYKKVVDAVEAHKKDIKDALYKATDHMYWKIDVLPSYDNKIGGYNLHAISTNVVDQNTVIDDANVKRAIDNVKKLPFVSKAGRSSSYNKKMLTAIAIGLKIQ
jgi:hypothetical protein